MDEQWVPIDIHYNKLLDWLIDRRHCSLRWHHQLRDVRNKIKHAVPSLPKDIQSATHKEELSYFDCYDIMKYLLTVESNDKNLLGQYSSPLLKEWNDIIKSYERNNLHLAEGANVMACLVNYEIASLKKQINRCQQQQREYARKATDSQTSAHSLQMRFEEQCHEFEIEGKDVHSELTQLIQVQLPTIFSEVVSVVSSIQSAINYYLAFRASTVSNFENESDVLPVLNYFIKNGNTTVYEWKNGKPPNIAQQNENIIEAIVSESHQDSKEELVIDWGDFESTDIDFDYSNMDVDLSEITVEDGGESITTTTYPTLLEDVSTRNLMLDDLMELLEFTKQRVNECTSSDTGGILQVDLPALVQAYSSEDIQDMVDKINVVINKLTNKKTQQLLLMLGSQSYLDRISSQLLHQKEMSQRATSLAVDHTYKIKESGQLQIRYEDELKTLVQETKRIKNLVAKEISMKYNNRTVNIIGEINQL